MWSWADPAAEGAGFPVGGWGPGIWYLAAGPLQSPLASEHSRWSHLLGQMGSCPTSGADCVAVMTNRYRLSTWPGDQLPLLRSLLSLPEQSSRARFSSSPSCPGTAGQLVIASSIAKQ